ncbi:MAG: glycosyltransferase family 4 protein [Gemmatimonadetes bacterium]|nr:glycosyltransferase family 4 protein [Gemmatimonadota bacterium]
MKIAVVHERYIQPGGEDRAFESETALLESRGHDVVRYEQRNDQIPEMGRLSLAARAHWNARANRRLRRLLHEERPDVVHFHNTFPILGPSAYWAAKSEGLPVVQTLHNYRLLCPNAQLYRDGGPCEDCVGRRFAWPSILHSCYHHGRLATGVVASTFALHRGLGTFSRKVDRYVALTEFGRRKFVEGGLPPESVRVKPNFLDEDPGMGRGGGGYALFVGRLSEEKGVRTLVEAWERLRGRIPLKVVGDGPESPRVASAAERIDGIEWLGRRPREEVLERMREARLLVFPSVWYEGLPFVIVEAFAAGLPVVASDLGGMSEIIRHGETGWLVPAGDPAALAKAVESAAADPEALQRVRRAGRAEFDSKYTATINYERLMAIYAEVVARRTVGKDTGGIPADGDATG